jgi:hypothetical protein
LIFYSLYQIARLGVSMMTKMYFLFLLVLSFGSTLALNGTPIEITKTKIQDPPGTRCTRLRYEPKPEAKEATIGTLCSRSQHKPRDGSEFISNAPPKVGLSSSTSHISPGGPAEVQMEAIACDLEGDTLLYTYTVTAGRLSGDGANAVWSLAGVAPGTYSVTVEVDDGCGCISYKTASITVAGN